MSWIDRAVCGLTGHASALRTFEDGRMFLRCACGYDSPGWQITAPAETPKPGQRNLLVIRGNRKAA